MTLLVFDIDGTLTDTAGLHGQFVADALARTGITKFRSDWSTYRHHTDSGRGESLVDLFDRARLA